MFDSTVSKKPLYGVDRSKSLLKAAHHPIAVIYIIPNQQIRSHTWRVPLGDQIGPRHSGETGHCTLVLLNPDRALARGLRIALFLAASVLRRYIEWKNWCGHWFVIVSFAFSYSAFRSMSVDYANRHSINNAIRIQKATLIQLWKNLYDSSPQRFFEVWSC